MYMFYCVYVRTQHIQCTYLYMYIHTLCPLPSTHVRWFDSHVHSYYVSKYANLAVYTDILMVCVCVWIWVICCPLVHRIVAFGTYSSCVQYYVHEGPPFVRTCMYCL